MNIQKNQIFTVKITDMGIDGEGIGHLEDSGALSGNGYTLFVKDAVLGDTVRAKVVKPKKGYAFARLEEVLEPSPDRVEPVCAYARQCGGCQLQAVSYEKQLAFKDRKVKNNLIRIGGFAPDFVEEIMEAPVGMEHPFHYRNKAQFPVGMDKNGRLIAAFMPDGHTRLLKTGTVRSALRKTKSFWILCWIFVRKRKFQHTMKRQERDCCAMS